MAARTSPAQHELAKQVAGSSLLSDFLLPFPNLLGQRRTELAVSFKRIASALAGSKRTGAIQFTIREGRQTRRWCLTLTPGDCHVEEAAIENPNLEVITDAAVWADIASGKVSPLEAFGSGKVRVRGDIELARVLAKRLKR